MLYLAYFIPSDGIVTRSCLVADCLTIFDCAKMGKGFLFVPMAETL